MNGDPYGYEYDGPDYPDHGPSDYEQGYRDGKRDCSEDYDRGFEAGKIEGRKLAKTITDAISRFTQTDDGPCVVILDGEQIFRGSELHSFVAFRDLMRKGLTVTLEPAPKSTDIPF